jgi:hypothetical protein
VVEIFCSLYADGVPPDGLEEVYRLHERARGGIERLNPRVAAALAGGEEPHDDHALTDPDPALAAPPTPQPVERGAIQDAAG